MKFKEGPSIFHYKVKLNKSCLVTDDSEENRQEDCEHSFEWIRKADSKFPDVSSTVDLTKTPGYLVWVEWDTGDSFSSTSRGHADCIALLSTESDAKKLKKYIENYKDQTKDYEFQKQKPNPFEFKASDQVVTMSSVPWLGWFEKLAIVHIQPVSTTLF